jgi:hypothetical protein
MPYEIEAWFGREVAEEQPTLTWLTIEWASDTAGCRSNSAKSGIKDCT